MTSEVPWTLAFVEERLRDLAPPAPAPAPPSLSAYIDAASVLAFFEIAKLRPVEGGEADSAPPPELFDSLERVVAPDGSPKLALRVEVRREALARLVTDRKWQSALDANPSRVDVPAQRFLEGFLSGRPVAVDELQYEELCALAEVREWLDGVIEDLPAREVIHARRAQEELLQPLRDRTLHFAGRAKELEILRSYVGVRRAATGGTDFDPVPVGRLEERPPLVFWGIGGVGKSTLISKFVLEHVDVPDAERFPFAYVDLDRVSVDVDRPLTLILEVLRQCVILAPALTAALAPLREKAEKALHLASSSSERLLEADFLSQLRSALSARYADGLPFVLVLDTFERAQYARGDALGRLWGFFEDLQRVIPSGRVIVAGRSQISGKLVQRPHELSSLDEDAGLAVLSKWGIEDTQTARLVFEKVGGNPLALRLAAGIVAREKSFSLEVRDLVDQELNLGVLYRRILDHLGTDEVRQLAHPGLVLRFLTPDLIRTVLAEPCGVSVPNKEAARKLFDELRRETALVTSEGEVLRHRADVRRVMLRLLREDEAKRDGGKRVEEIHSRAVRYFHETVVDPVEEQYHRLCLDQSATELDEHRQRQVVHLLADAIEELPPRARAWLAAELEIEPDAEARAKAEPVVWERDAARRVERLLISGSEADLQAALRVLDERAKRTEQGRLHALEAEALLRVGDMPKAIAAADRALSAAESLGDRAREIQALTIQARVARAKNDPEAALASLTRGGQIAREIGESEAYFEAAVSRLELAELLGNKELLTTIVAEVSAEKVRAKKPQPDKLERRLTAVLGRVSAQDHAGRLSGADRAALAKAMTESLASTEALDELLRYDLDVPIGAVASTGDLSSSVLDTIEYFESRDETADLLGALLQRRPGVSTFRRLLTRVRGTPGPEAPQGAEWLPGKLLEEVERAAKEANLDRDVLFNGLDTAYVASLPRARTSTAQLRSDLAQLNSDHRLVNGVIPLRWWLMNAAMAALDAAQRRVFLQALSQLPGGDTEAVARSPRRVFLAYAPEDKAYRDELLKHVAPLVSRGMAVFDHEDTIHIGMDKHAELIRMLESAHVVIALVSAALLASEPHDELLARAESRKIRIVPVLIRPVALFGSRFDGMKMLPDDRKPIGSPKNDRAWAHVTEEIRKLVEAAPVRDVLLSTSPPITDSAVHHEAAEDETLRIVADALREAFPTRTRLDRMLRTEMGIRLDTIVARDTPFDEATVELVRWGMASARLSDILSGAIEQNPDHEGLQAAARKLALETEEPVVRGFSPRFENLLLRGTGFSDVLEWRSGMDSVARCVCQLEYRVHDGSESMATAFLVGPDVLLTNEHVVSEMAPGTGQARFDFVKMDDASRDRLVRLSPDPILAASPVDDLDYALLRLADSVGDDEIHGGIRGFLVPSEDTPSRGESVAILSHPEGQPLKLSTGVVLERPREPRPERRLLGRLWYTVNTAPGTSGAPVCRADWRVVAMHERNIGDASGGVTMRAIMDHLRKRDALHLLGRGDPGGPRRGGDFRR